MLLSLYRQLKTIVYSNKFAEKMFLEVLFPIVLPVCALFTIFRTYRVFRTIRHAPSRGENTVIVLGVRSAPATIWGGDLIHSDALFAHAFKKNGAQAKVLYHDGLLSSTDAQTVFRSERAQRVATFLCGWLMKRSLFVDAISYYDYCTKQDSSDIKQTVAQLNPSELEHFMYCGVHVGQHAKASTIRYFLSGLIDLADASHVAVFRKKLVDAIIATRVAKGVAQRQKPKLLFLLHGIYATWGPFLEYFRNHNIQTVMYGNMPSRFGHFIFYRNAKVNAVVAPRQWEMFKKLPLTRREEEQADGYFERRVQGNDGDQKIYEKNFDQSLNTQELLKSLDSGSYQRRFIMYTNLAWDVYVEGHESKFFSDVFDWIDKTITLFKSLPQYQLIIKPHPGELIWEKSSQSIREYIKQTYPELPPNITVLPPNVPCTAYDLLTPNAIGMVYNGSLGLDLANLAIPVLVVADIHYKDAGVVYPIDTLQEYLNLVKNPKPVFAFAKSQQKLAKKYAYYYYYKIMMRIPYYRDDEWSVINWQVMADTKKLLAPHSPLVTFASLMMKGEDVINPL